MKNNNVNMPSIRYQCVVNKEHSVKRVREMIVTQKFPSNGAEAVIRRMMSIVSGPEAL